MKYIYSYDNTFYYYFREKWTSIVHHVVNKHRWDTAEFYHQCAHAVLTSEESRRKKWLKPQSEAFRALQAVVFEKRLLEALDQLTRFCHTGPLEVYHSMYTKYIPKRQHFSHKGKQFTIYRLG